MLEAIRRIINHKTLFRLYPLIATIAELERETGEKRTEIARISQELAKDGQIHYGKTINGNYCRLLKELKSQDMKSFIVEIKAHLEKVAQTDETFASKFRAKCENEENSVDKCAGYIVAEVQKNYKKGGYAVLTKDEVFGMAMHYYDEDLKNVKTAKCQVVVAKDELTEEDKERIRQQVREDAERAVRVAEEAKIAREKAKADAEAKAKRDAAEERRKQAERKKQEELERKRKEYETADLLFSFEDED